MENLVGKKLGRCCLTRHLARGGMSEIYLASDEEREQMYALKLVWQMDEEYCLRFQRERDMLMHFKHPNILPILDAGEQDGLCYSVMPYIAHGTLKDRITVGPLSVEEAETILIQVADALQFLHEAGSRPGEHEWSVSRRRTFLHAQFRADDFWPACRNASDSHPNSFGEGFRGSFDYTPSALR